MQRRGRLLRPGPGPAVLLAIVPRSGRLRLAPRAAARLTTAPLCPTAADRLTADPDTLAMLERVAPDIAAGVRTAAARTPAERRARMEQRARLLDGRDAEEQRLRNDAPHPDAVRLSWSSATVVPAGPGAPDSVPEDWSRRRVARTHDPAAVWLAECRPDELESWPAAEL